MNLITNTISAVYNLLWGDLFAIPLPCGSLGTSLLVLMLIPTGIYFTIRTRFLPIRMFPEMLRVTAEKHVSSRQGSISGLQALVVSTATRVGMGNLIGVVAAISAGGAGAVFWMWVSALIGSSTAFIEATLAQLYREKDPLYGGYRGGPAYYIHRFVEQKLGGKTRRYSVIAVLFALSGLICWCGISQVISNSVSSAFQNAFEIPPLYTTLVLVALVIAVLFALSGLICWCGISQVISNSVSSAFQNAFEIPPLYTTLVLVALSAVIVLRKNATVKVLDVLVPIMAVCYFAMTIFLILKNITVLPSVFHRIFEEAFGIRQVVAGGFGAVVMNGVKRGLMTIFLILKNITVLPSVFHRIFEEAFGIRQVVAGGFGAVVMNGVKRGLFSNEAGSGSAPCAAAAGDTGHPAKTGLLQALGVFIDTIVICSCTAFIMLVTPQDQVAGLEGMDLLQASMNYHLGRFGVVFIALMLGLFCFSTFIGILFYARSNVAYLFGDNWASQTAYKVVALVMLFIGGLAAYTFVWDLGDVGVGLMTVFNIIMILPLSGQALASLRDYEGILKAARAEKKDKS